MNGYCSRVGGKVRGWAKLLPYGQRNVYLVFFSMVEWLWPSGILPSSPGEHSHLSKLDGALHPQKYSILPPPHLFVIFSSTHCMRMMLLSSPSRSHPQGLVSQVIKQPVIMNRT